MHAGVATGTIRRIRSEKHHSRYRKEGRKLHLFEQLEIEDALGPEGKEWARLRALFTLLYEKGVFTADEYQDRYQRHLAEIAEQRGIRSRKPDED